MSSRACWLKVAPNGAIEEVLFCRSSEPPSPDHTVPVRDSKWFSTLTNSGGRNVYWDAAEGEPKFKPEVELRADREVIPADGASVARIEVVPPRAVALLVDGHPVQLPAGEALEVSWDTPGPVLVELDEPLVQASPITLEFE